MSLANTATKALTERMPKVFDAKTHAIMDYAMAGTFVALGAWFWKRNRRAALAAFVSAAATAVNSLVTDYPGGVTDAISFETHGKIDSGLAAMTASAPTFLAFGDEEEAKYFRGLALVETVVIGLTDFSGNTRGNVVEFPAHTA